MESLLAARSRLSRLSDTLDQLSTVGMVGLLLIFAGVGVQLVSLVVMVLRNRKNKSPKSLTIKGGLEVIKKEEKKPEPEKDPVCPHVPPQHYPSKELVLLVDISADRPPRDICRLVSSVCPRRLPA